MILVDSNVIIDVTNGDSRWSAWSMAKVVALAETQTLAVNEVVVAEVAPSLGSLSAFQREMAIVSIGHERLTAEAAYCAGIAFTAYRKNRRLGLDQRSSIIADFLIGGHAQTLGASILTRDPRFYRAYFPTVPLITPDKAEP